MSGNKIKVLSANCQGLQNKQKRTDVLGYFTQKDANILCLPGTHWIEKDLKDIKIYGLGTAIFMGLKQIDP